GRGEAGGEHALEDVAPAPGRAVGMAARIVPARRLRQAREQGGLPERELGRLDIEELARRGRDAVRAGAEVDVVQVQVEDLVLRELRLELEREDEFLRLALEASLRRQQQLLDDLLRDRARTLDDLAVTHVGDQRARDARDVDPGVAVEVGVLGGEKREANALRYVRQRKEVAALDVELADPRAVRREDAGRGRGPVVEELRDRREVLRELAPDRDAHDRRERDRRERGPRGEAKEPPHHGSSSGSTCAANRTSGSSTANRACTVGGPHASSRPGSATITRSGDTSQR